MPVYYNRNTGVKTPKVSSPATQQPTKPPRSRKVKETISLEPNPGPTQIQDNPSLVNPEMREEEE